MMKVKSVTTVKFYYVEFEDGAIAARRAVNLPNWEIRYGCSWEPVGPVIEEKMEQAYKEYLRVN